MNTKTVTLHIPLFAINSCINKFLIFSKFAFTSSLFALDSFQVYFQCFQKLNLIGVTYAANRN